MKKRNKIILAVSSAIVFVAILVTVLLCTLLPTQKELSFNVSSNLSFYSSEGTRVGVSGKILAGADVDTLAEVETMEERKNFQDGEQDLVTIADWAPVEEIVLNKEISIVRYEVTFTNYSNFDIVVTVNNPSEHNDLTKVEDTSELALVAQNGTGTYTVTYTLGSIEEDNEFVVDVDFSIDNYLPDAVGFMSGSHAVEIADSLPDGTYTLKYEDESGVLADYADICMLENGESYTGFITQNMAPQEAIKIGVYNSTGDRVGSVGLIATFNKNLGEKLYSFGAISDVHIGNNTSETDFERALTYFNDQSVQFVTVNGDLCVGSQTDKLEIYASLIEQHSDIPVYSITGNHEAELFKTILQNNNLTSEQKVTQINDVIDDYTGQNLYYTFTQGNDVYIMLGVSSAGNTTPFIDIELEFLYNTLEQNKDKRCFVFMHYYARNGGSGDAVNLDMSNDNVNLEDKLNNTYGKTFLSLMSHYSNVTWFHGHSHQMFEIQAVNGKNTYDNLLGIHSVHVPSITTPKMINQAGSAVTNYDAGSQGYVVDVYENYVVLRGRDFASGKFLPIASFCLDTTLKAVEANTYYDETQTIVNKNSNILKEADTWYQSTMAKSEITKISFVTNFNPTTYDESWDASISGNNQVMAYRIGTEVYLVGNENGIIANSNSDKLFANFTNVTEIVGLEKLNTSNIVTTKVGTDPNAGFKNVFYGCANIETIDISMLDLSMVSNTGSLFHGCKKLVTVKLPTNLGAGNNGKGSVSIGGMFNGCESLLSFDFTGFTTQKTFYVSGLFKDCSSLESVNMANIKITSLSSMFADCKKLKEVDLTQNSISVAELELAYMFKGCVELTTIKFPTTIAFNTSATKVVTSLQSMFSGCAKLTTLVLPTNMASNVSTITNFQSTFDGCALLTIDLSDWDVSSCTDSTNFNRNADGVTPPTFPTEE